MRGYVKSRGWLVELVDGPQKGGWLRFQEPIPEILPYLNDNGQYELHRGETDKETCYKWRDIPKRELPDLLAEHRARTAQPTVPSAQPRAMTAAMRVIGKGW